MTLAENLEHLFKRAAFKGDFSHCTYGHPAFGRGHGNRGKSFRFETNAGYEHYGRNRKSREGEWYRLFYQFKRKMHCKHRRHRGWKRRFGGYSPFARGFSSGTNLSLRDRCRFHFAENRKRAILIAVAFHHLWCQQAEAPWSTAKHHVDSFCRSLSLGLCNLMNSTSPLLIRPHLDTDKRIASGKRLNITAQSTRPNVSARCTPLSDLILKSSSAAFESARSSTKRVSNYLPMLLNAFGDRPASPTASARSEATQSQPSTDDTLYDETQIEDKFGDSLPLHVTSLAESAVVDFAMPSPLENASVSSSLGDQSPNGVLTQLRSYIARLQGVARDIESIATLGDLPFSIELNGSVLRVHFPNSDSQSLSYLLQDKEVTNGQVSEVTLDVEDIDEQVVPLLSYSPEDAGVSDSDPTPGLSFSDGSETFESSLSTVTESYYSFDEL